MAHEGVYTWGSVTKILSNTAQVLTSLVEVLSESRSDVGSREDELCLLKEAIELFQRCLTLQEYNLTESEARAKTEASTPRDSEAGEQPGSQVAREEERWAMVIEPVTNDTLLDTVLAQLECLTTLCQLITDEEERGLAWIEEYSAGLLSQKIPEYVKGTDREEEAALTKANFMASLANASFQCQRIDVSTYERALEDAYGELDLSHDPEGLCDRAEALIAYDSALRNSLFRDTQGESAATRRWKALTAALDALTAASQMPSADNMAKIHLARGDVELLRFQLSQPPSLLSIAVRNSAMLLKNAGTFYRGAESNGRALSADTEVKEAVIKQALAEALGSNHERLKELLTSDPHACDLILEEAVDDGLIDLGWILGWRNVLMEGTS
jgi:hypothetical protein